MTERCDLTRGVGMDTLTQTPTEGALVLEFINEDLMREIIDRLIERGYPL